MKGISGFVECAFFEIILTVRRFLLQKDVVFCCFYLTITVARHQHRREELVFLFKHKQRNKHVNGVNRLVITIKTTKTTKKNRGVNNSKK